MLVDLQPFDVVVCQRHRDRGSNDEVTNGRLSSKGATKSAAGNYGSANVAEGCEDNDQIAVDTMEEDGFVAYDGEELEDHEDASRDYCGKVESYPNAVDAVLVPEPLAGDSARFEGGGGVAANVEIREAREGEAEHGAAEDEDCGC